MKKLVLLALAAVSAVLFALPAVASAGEWEVDPAGVTFTAVNSGITVLTTSNNETVTCTGSSGSGAYNATSKTTGTIELSFTGCTESVFGSSCSNTATAGKITTTTVTFTNEYVTDNKTSPGVTLKGTGAEEHFATFTCASGGVEIKVTGTVMGQLEANECGTTSTTHKLEFNSISHGVQEHTKVTGTGTSIYDLSARVKTIFGTNTYTASQDGTGILTFSQAATVTCV